MNFVTAVLYVILIGLILGIFLPWWIIVVPCVMAGFFTEVKSFKAFLVGFLPVFLLWGVYCAYIYLTGHSTLPQQISELLMLPGGASLIIISALLAALVGGFASLSGHSLRVVVD